MPAALLTSSRVNLIPILLLMFALGVSFHSSTHLYIPHFDMFRYLHTSWVFNRVGSPFPDSLVIVFLSALLRYRPNSVPFFYFRGGGLPSRTISMYSLPYT